jgi:hypothetical protein
MTRQIQTALAGVVLLLPALILVTSGVLGLNAPGAVVHPALVMGGLVLACLLNALSVFRVAVRHEGDDLLATVAVRVRGTALNLMALTAVGALFAIIAAYLFVENFQPR